MEGSMWLSQRVIRCLHLHFGQPINLEPVPAVLHRKPLRHLGLVAALFVISSGAIAQGVQRVTLSGHVNPRATPANDRGRVAASLQLSYVTLTLTQSAAQKADLANL